jgi:hypothetical protein
MNIQLRHKMNRFREKWSNAELLRPRLGPMSTEEERKAANEAERQSSDRMHAEFLVEFASDEINEIRIHLDENLRPQIVPAEPQPLQSGLPVHEVREDVMNEYYFFRALL